VVQPKAAVVRDEEARAQEKADAAKAIKDECEADLAEVCGTGLSAGSDCVPCAVRGHTHVHMHGAQAIPILNEALSALDTIKEADVAYIKKLTNPPGAIKLVLEAVCVILDVKPVKVRALGVCACACVAAPTAAPAPTPCWPSPAGEAACHACVL
jgi:dynein heavy chain